jgi:hypothetical protein
MIEHDVTLFRTPDGSVSRKYLVLPSPESKQEETKPHKANETI